MTILGILFTIKEFLVVPNLPLLLINIFFFALTRVIIVLLIFFQPIIYKTFSSHACNLLEWSVYLLLSQDAFISSLTLSYFFHKFDLRCFALLNLSYSVFYFLFNRWSKFNKQYYFTLLATPAPSTFSSNNNLNVPPSILQFSCTPRAKVFLTNMLFLILKGLLLAFVTRNVFKALVKRYIHDTCDQESINCYLCEFGGMPMGLESLTTIFFMEFVGSLFLCWLVFLVENSRRRVSVFALSSLTRLLVLAFQHTLGYKPRYIYFLPISPLSLFIQCPHNPFFLQTLAAHLLGCLLGAEALKLMLYSQIKKEQLGKKMFVESIMRNCSSSVSSGHKRESPAKCCKTVLRKRSPSTPVLERLRELRSTMKCANRRPCKVCLCTTKESEVSIPFLESPHPSWDCMDSFPKKSKHTPCSNDKSNEINVPINFTDIPNKRQCCLKKFLPGFYLEKSKNYNDSQREPQLRRLSQQEPLHRHVNSHPNRKLNDCSREQSDGFLRKRSVENAKTQQNKHSNIYTNDYEKKEGRIKKSVRRIDPVESCRRFLKEYSDNEKDQHQEKDEMNGERVSSRREMLGSRLSTVVEWVEKNIKKTQNISPIETYSQELLKLGSSNEGKKESEGKGSRINGKQREKISEEKTERRESRIKSNDSKVSDRLKKYNNLKNNTSRDSLSENRGFRSN